MLYCLTFTIHLLYTHPTYTYCMLQLAVHLIIKLLDYHNTWDVILPFSFILLKIEKVDDDNDNTQSARHCVKHFLYI